MTYALVAVFLLTGNVYLERSGLTLEGCAGQAAKLRQETEAVLATIKRDKGEVRYFCLPERSTVVGWP